MRLFFFFSVFLMMALLSSCDKGMLYEENAAIPKGKWHKDSSYQFTFEVKDTVTLYNFYMNIRNGEEYEYSNLYTFNELSFPNGKKAVDTLECTLCDLKGKWYGKGLGDLYESRHIYKDGIRFPLTAPIAFEYFRRCVKMKSKEFTI